MDSPAPQSKGTAKFVKRPDLLSPINDGRSRNPNLQRPVALVKTSASNSIRRSVNDAGNSEEVQSCKDGACSFGDSSRPLQYYVKGRKTSRTNSVMGTSFAKRSNESGELIEYSEVKHHPKSNFSKIQTPNSYGYFSQTPENSISHLRAVKYINEKKELKIDEERTILSSLISNAIVSLLLKKSENAFETYTIKLNVYNNSEIYDTFLITLKVSSKGRMLFYTLDCEKYYFNKDLTSNSRASALPLKNPDLESFSHLKMLALLENVEQASIVPTNRNVLQFRRYNTLIESCFLKGLMIELNTTRDALILKYSRIPPGFCEITWTCNQERPFKVRIIHNYHYCFRVLIIDINRQRILYWFDVILDKVTFDDFFEEDEKNFIGQFHKDAITTKELHSDPEKIKEKQNKIKLRTPIKLPLLKEFLKDNILNRFKSVMGFTQTNLEDLKISTTYCLMNESTHLQKMIVFFLQEREGDGVLEIDIIDPQMNEKLEFKITSIQYIEQVFCIEWSKLTPSSKYYFYTVACKLQIKNQNISEIYYKRIFPGIYYKSPLTITLLSMGEYHPLGLRVGNSLTIKAGSVFIKSEYFKWHLLSSGSIKLGAR